ncbi:zinc finger protein RFP-like [Platysternon megacephalum]|uniref:Zinc finger protein RFP-like n=1 Tax=Platysternon megacephalum TaxID=55544 RepID=A0A4D9DP59_9SAUR|nr:zinc finger protein RFP-like [Platysternon megacephalum]
MGQLEVGDALELTEGWTEKGSFVRMETFHRSLSISMKFDVKMNHFNFLSSRIQTMCFTKVILHFDCIVPVHSNFTFYYINFHVGLIFSIKLQGYGISERK